MGKAETGDLYPEVGLPEFYAVSRKAQDDGRVLYVLHPKGRPNMCPECGGVTLHVHKKARRTVQDIDMLGHEVSLTVEGNSYRCRDCGALVRMEYPSLHGRMTSRLVRTIQLDAVSHTFSDVAHRFHTTATTVKALFEEYADECLENRVPAAPEVLGLGGVYLEDSPRSVFVSCDGSGGSILELTEDWSLESTCSAISSLDELSNINLVSIDMCRPYRSAVHRCLPGTPVAVNHMNVIDGLITALDTARSAICRGMSVEARKAVRHNRYLLLRNNEVLTARQAGDLERLLERVPAFGDIYMLKEAFRDIYAQAGSSEEARKMFYEWKHACSDAGVDAYDGFITAIIEWEDEVFEYFSHPCLAALDAQIADIKRVVLTIARSGRGYTFDVLRKKALLNDCTGSANDMK